MVVVSEEWELTERKPHQKVRVGICCVTEQCEQYCVCGTMPHSGPMWVTSECVSCCLQQDGQWRIVGLSAFS